MKSRFGIGLVLAAFLLAVMAGCTPQPVDNLEDVARDIAIARANAQGFPVPVGITWIKEPLPSPEGIVMYRYTEGLVRSESMIPPPLWVIEVSAPVVPRPDYSVNIMYLNEKVWSGTILYQDVIR